MANQPREIMLVGSVPLKPASAVFEAVSRHDLAPLMKRIPDGEQAGWDKGMFSLYELDVFEISRRKRMTLRPSTFFADLEVPYVRLKAGLKPEDVHVESLGIAENAERSFAEFRKSKAEGLIPAEARFCVTIAGPGTMFGPVELPAADLFPLAERAFKTELAKVLNAIPHDELAIQLDLAVEAEIEEYRRRPEAFELPAFADMDWTLEDTSNAIANIANTIPEEVELGFHLCAIYHIDESQGQDLAVHVDLSNALSEKISRPIGYIHLPTVPTHDEADFAALRQLRLHPETRLFLGVIHAELGEEGAERLIRAAAKSYPDFGIAAFCGLRQPSRREFENPHTVDEILEMHRHAAHCSS